MKPGAHLLVATPLYPPDAGGPATYAHILESELPKHGVAITIAKFGEVRHLPKILRHIAYLRLVLRSAKKADAILALDPVSVGLSAYIAARIAGKPFYVKVVGDYAWEQGTQRFGLTATLDEFVEMRHVSLPVQILRTIESFVAKRAKGVIVPSYYLNNIVRTWGVSEERLSVVYNAVSVEGTHGAPESITCARQPLVLTTGRLVPWKHIDRIIDAVDRMASMGTRAELAIIGTGPLEKSLRAHAADAKHIDVVFLGQQNHSDTLGALTCADVFVLNSSYEGLSHVLIEALMLGKAVIATNAGGNPELIQDGVNGLLVPVGDTSALSEAIKRVCEDSVLRATLEEGARTSSKNFSVENMVQGTLAALP